MINILKELKLSHLTLDSKVTLLVILWILDKIIMTTLFLVFQ